MKDYFKRVFKYILAITALMGLILFIEYFINSDLPTKTVIWQRGCLLAFAIGMYKAHKR